MAFAPSLPLSLFPLAFSILLLPFRSYRQAFDFDFLSNSFCHAIDTRACWCTEKREGIPDHSALIVSFLSAFGTQYCSSKCAVEGCPWWQLPSSSFWWWRAYTLDVIMCLGSQPPSNGRYLTSSSLNRWWEMVREKINPPSLEAQNEV